MASTRTFRRHEISGRQGERAVVVSNTQTRRHPEHLVLARRAENQRRGVYEALAKDDEFVMKRINFEVQGDRRIKANAVTRRAKEIQAQEEENLEHRRRKLKALLEEEEEQYLNEAVQSVQTSLDKEAQMRERARYLREKRETERQQLARDLMERAWQENCEPLRALTHQKNKEALSTDLMLQIEEKKMISEHQREVDEYYEECERMEYLAKTARDEADKAAMTAGNADQVAYLRSQIQMLEDNREEARRLKEKERVLRLEQAELLKEEERREQQEAHDKKLRMRRILDDDKAERTKIEDARLAEEMEYERKLIEQINQQLEDDSEGAIAKKKRLAEETKVYMDYLNKLQAYKDEMEAAHDEAMERIRKQVYDREMSRFRGEQNKRKGLMKEVITVIKEQMKEKEEQIAEERRLAHEEGLEIAAKVAKLNKKAEQEEKQVLEKNMMFGTMLESQIREVEDRRHRERQDEKDLIRSLEAMNRAEDEKIAQALHSATSKMDTARRASMDALSISGQGL